MGTPFTTEEYVDSSYVEEKYVASSYVEEKYVASHYGDKVERFDILTHRVYLNEGVTSYHPVEDIYKEMRFFRRVDITNRVMDKFTQAEGNLFKGTDENGIDHYTPRLVIFLNGWKIIPHHNNGIPYILNVTGEQISDIGESGASLMDVSGIDTAISINYTPAEAEILIVPTETSVTPAEVATAVWNDSDSYAEGTKGHKVEHSDYIEHIVFLDEEVFPVVGVGTEYEPFGKTSNALTFAELHGFRTIGLLSNFDVDRDIHNFTVRGIGAVPFVDTGTNNIDKSTFFQVKLKGLFLGSIVARDCTLGNGTPSNINGEFDNCAITGDVRIPDGGSALLNRCTTSVNGFIKPKVSIGGAAGTAQASIMGHAGGLTISDMTQVTDTVKITDTGIVEIDSSCQEGNVVVIGLVQPIDNSGPGCTVQWLNMDAAHIRDMWQLMGLDKANPTVTTQSSTDVGNIHMNVTGDGVNTSTITRTN